MSSLLSTTLAAADAAVSPRTACFSVCAQAEPGVMPRVLELFAKRGLVPHTWHSAASPSSLSIDIQVAGLGGETVEYIANCMRQIAGVQLVLTSEGRLTG